MKNIFKSVLLTLLVSASFTSCVDHSYEDSVNTCVDPGLTANKTVQDIVAQATSVPTLYTQDDIIEAYVTSNDQKGHFYKSISFQSIPVGTAAPIGFSVSVNAVSTFTEGFYPGKKVYIKLKGLYTAIVYNSLTIGSTYQASPTAPVEIGRISENEYKNYLIPSCDEVSEDTIVRPFNIAQAVTNANLNTLIDLTNVQFVDGSLNRTLYDVDSGGGATNHLVSTTVGTGAPLILRVSSFAPFSHNMVPTGSGTIRGVLTKYGSDFQFIVRDESDFVLNGPRVDSYPAIGGTALVYSGTVNEPFTSYTTTNFQVFPKYINDAVVGTRYWQVKTFSGNKYIQMSSFGGTPEVNRTMFIVPVDMTAASNFSFKTLSGYDNGSCLKIYYSMNYVPGSDVNTATLVDITSNFNIPAGPAAAYASSFTSSGVYAIPAALTGNGYFFFEYKGNGNGGVTTTMEVDDILIN